MAVCRRASTTPCRTLYNIVVVQLMQHRQLTEIRRRRGALRNWSIETFGLAAFVFLIRLGYIYAVAFKKLGALQMKKWKWINISVTLASNKLPH